MGKATKSKWIGYEDAVAELDLLKPRVARGAEDLRRHSARAAAAAKELKDLRARQKLLQRIVDRGAGREAPVREKVENPMRAGDLVAQQLADDDVGKLIEAGKFNGLVEVDIRLSTRIGGLARIKERDEWQTLAAARFRSLWDQAQIGGAKAIDYSQVRVDTSGSSADAVSTMGEDARRHYQDAVQALGPLKANLVQRVVCDDMSLRALARKLGRPDGGRDRAALRKEVLDSVDVLVREFKMGPARPRGGIRAEGERPTGWTLDQTDSAEQEQAA